MRSHRRSPLTPRVVYVDADPVVLVHGRALQASSDKVTIQSDLGRPEELLDTPELRALIDFAEPVAVLLVAVLHAVTDAEDPIGIVTRLRDAMTPGSYLVLPIRVRRATRKCRQGSGAVLRRAAPRTRAGLAVFRRVRTCGTWSGLCAAVAS
jgi:S-adenosyl methyltransferase